LGIEPAQEPQGSAADVGIGPGAIVSLAREAGVRGLRRPPHV